MFDWLEELFFFGRCLLFPMWAMQVTGLPVAAPVVAAVQLGLIVLSALRPVWWRSRAGRVAQRALRIALTIVAIAAVNFVLNLIWQTNI